MDNNKMIVAAVVVLALLGGGIYYATRDDSSSDSSLQTTTTNTSTQTANESAAKDEMSSQDIVQLASATTDLGTLVKAVQAADLVETLKGTGPFTVFAPTNAAFSKLPAATLDTLLMPENKTQLQSILTYHVVPAKAMSSDLKDGQEITTVQGAKLMVGIANGEVTLIDAVGNKSKVTKADIMASNGVVHMIDTVVMPQ